MSAPSVDPISWTACRIADAPVNVPAVKRSGTTP